MDDKAERKINFILYAPCAIGPVSLLGSALTLTAIYRARLGGTRLTTYHRLMAAISISDMILSTALAFGPLPMPEEMRMMGVDGARGNRQSCTTQAFFLQLGFASFFYSQFLMLYFVLVIRCNVKESFMARRFEPFMLAIPILFHLTTAIIGIIWEVFNSNGGLCWTAAYPLGCGQDSDNPCERGEKHLEFFDKWLLLYPFVGWNILILFWLLVVAVTVILRFQRTRSYYFEGSDNVGQASRDKTMRRVIVQCFLYAVWFINVMVWSSIGTIAFVGMELHHDQMGKHYWMMAMNITFFPLHGLFNFLIYIRPTFDSIREEFPTLGRWFALRSAVWHPADYSSSGSRRLAAVQNRAPGPNNASAAQVLPPQESKTGPNVVALQSTPKSSIEPSMHEGLSSISALTSSNDCRGDEPDVSRQDGSIESTEVSD